MNKLNDLLKTIIEEDRLIHAVLSRPGKKGAQYVKVTVRPVIIKEQQRYQFEFFSGSQTIQKNLTPDEAISELVDLLQYSFRQALVNTPDAGYQILISKKGKVTILNQPPTREETDRNANRVKQRIIPEGTPCPFLVKLGVMNDKGKVLGNNYDKFRQINKFLEIVSDCLPALGNKKQIEIVDFGSGKGYLTFAIHHYLNDLLDAEIQTTGVDQNESLVNFCNTTADQLDYTGLRFIEGDIRDASVERADIVVALHACDTATDEALAKAIGWGAKVILAAPCCQHELAGQIDNDMMRPLLKHGIMKERLAALLTDALRANLLEQQGYLTQILEFIDLEGTPKNLLIRALRTGKADADATRADYESLKKFFQIDPCLERLLEK